MKTGKRARHLAMTNIGVVGLCLSLALAGCEQQAEPVSAVHRVVAVSAGKDGLQSVETAVGRVAGATESVVMSKIAGRVVRVQADVGQSVQAGQPLVILDDRDYNVSLQQARAGLLAAQARLADAEKGTRPQQLSQLQEKIDAAKEALDQAKSDWQRMQALYQSGALPKADVEKSELAVKQAESAYQQLLQEMNLMKEGATKETLEGLRANVAQMQAEVSLAQLNKSNTVIVAPMAGKIASVGIHPGEMATPGTPLLTIVSSQAVVEAMIPEESINDIKVGQTLNVRVPQVSSQPFAARVISVSPAADQSKQYPVKLAMPGDPGRWKSGMYAEVILSAKPRATVAVPKEALVKRDGKWLVMVTDGKKAVAKPVVLGKSDGTRVEIESGLSAGENVIVVGQDELKDGDAVDVVYEKVNGE